MNGTLEKQYPLSLFNKIFYGLMAALTAAAAFFMSTLSFDKSPAAKWVIVSIFTGSAVLFVLSLFKKMAIIPGTIIYRGLFGTRQIPFAAVKGYRWMPKAMIIEPVSAEYRRIVFSYTDHRHPEELREWIEARFTDLNAVDLQACYDELVHNERLGASAEERVQLQKRAKIIAAVYNVAGIIAALVSAFLEGVFPSVLLLLIPLAGIALLYTHKGLIKFYADSSRSMHAQVYIGIVFSSAFLIVHPFRYYSILHQGQLLLPALVIAGMVMLLVYKRGINHATGRLTTQVVLMLMAAGLYAVGAAQEINCGFDRSEAKPYAATIVRRYTTTGKYGKLIYHFEIGAWGPTTTNTKIKVSYDNYSRLDDGDMVTVFLKEGYLKIPWYWVE